MKLTFLDGTIDGVALRRPASRWLPAHYDAIDVIDPDGVTHTLRGVRAEPAVAGRIAVGAAGRFYLHDVAGFRGVHGFRPPRGAPVFAFPRLPAAACLAVALVNLAWIAWRTLAGAQPPAFAMAPFMLACLLYALARRAAVEARHAVLNDARPVLIPGQPPPGA
ncbi:hypothetical protein ACFOEX_00140 [Camelimonas abortus]|uniref:Uncharacterized protein n=1 Tax=Camelimonas abortus TaxID=1017184 RepID=A0ABV7LA96_9HYPH